MSASSRSSASEDLLIVGGGTIARASETTWTRARRIEHWDARALPGFGRPITAGRARCSSRSTSCLFSGRNPGNENIYIHTGDSGQGITNGVAGSLTILPLIIGEDSRYAPCSIRAASRRFGRCLIGEFVRGQAGAVKNLRASIFGPASSHRRRTEARARRIIRRGLAQGRRLSSDRRAR
jgi:hypothetical protein